MPPKNIFQTSSSTLFIHLEINPSLTLQEANFALRKRKAAGSLFLEGAQLQTYYYFKIIIFLTFT